jgi:hypothetical protein
MSLESFQSRCALLSAEEQREAGLIIQGRYSDAESDFGRAWRDLDLQIRQQIALLRSRTWNVSPAPAGSMSSFYSVRARNVVNDAFELDSPLEREWALDKGRWALIQDLTRPEDPFGLDRVLSYGLRLRLVHRWAVIDRDRGREEFDSLVRACMDEAQPLVQVSSPQRTVHHL